MIDIVLFILNLYSEFIFDLLTLYFHNFILKVVVFKDYFLTLYIM